MVKEKTITYGDFKLFFESLTEECRLTDLYLLNEEEKPKFIFGVEVPENFNLLDFGTYSDMCDAIGKENHFEVIDEITSLVFPKVSRKTIEKENVRKVWGFVNWAVKEIGRINELFSSIKVEYTDQEKRAGIDRLQFGTFGILDWYAKRMGIHDQNEVNNEKWVRIWQCMKNDSEETAFNRRLQKIYEQDAKKKH